MKKWGVVIGLITLVALASMLASLSNMHWRAYQQTSGIGIWETIVKKKGGNAPRSIHDSATASRLLKRFALLLQQQKDAADKPNTYVNVALDTSQPSDSVAVGKYQGAFFLQAPHGHSDINTRQIAELIIARSTRANAYFSNLKHRRELDFSIESPSILIDLTLAYLQYYPNAAVVQLHGFAKDKRSSPVAKNANFIISTGSRRMTMLASRFAECLNRAGFEEVAVFGKTVDELGATTNAVKKAMYQLQYSRFLHIEMSFEQRTMLKKSPAALDAFAGCLDEVTT